MMNFICLSTHGLFGVMIAFAMTAAGAGGPFDYPSWSRNPAIVTWAGSGVPGTTLDITSSSSAKFIAFDNSSGVWAENPDRTWVSTEDSSTIPGYIGSSLFWHAFSYAAAGYVGPGLALRFAPNDGTRAGTLDGAFTTMAIGGLLVESGATGYTLGDSTASTAIRHTKFGDPIYGGETYFDIRENFWFRRGASVGCTNTFYGSVNLHVADGKIFDVNSYSPEVLLELSTEVPTALRFSGDGRMQVAELSATGNVMLDFSALSLSRSQPFIYGSLIVDGSTVLRFPEGFSEGSSYKLCSGTLTAEVAGGVHPVTVGDETFFAEVTYNTSAKSVSYSRASVEDSVNRATIDENMTWSGIEWEESFSPGKPIEFTVTNTDVRLIFDADVTLGPIVINGDKELSLVMKRDHVFDGIYCSPAASYAIVYPVDGNQDLSKALSIGPRDKYVIEGGDSSVSLRTWTGSMTIKGELVTRGYVSLTSYGNIVYRQGHLFVDGGNLNFNSASGALKGALTVGEGAVFASACDGSLPDSSTDGARIAVHGELSLGTQRWVLAAASELELFAGGSITGDGDGNAAMDFDGITNVVVKAAEGADQAAISAALRFKQDAPLKIESGVTLMLSSTNSTYFSGCEVALSGEGSLNLTANSEIRLDSATTCTGGITGSGKVIYTGSLPPAAAMASFQDSEKWSGRVLLQTVSFSSLNPDSLGSFASTVAFSACSGSFAPGEIACQTKIELVADSSIALTVVDDNVGAITQLSRLTGAGKLVISGSSVSNGARVLIPDVSGYTGSITVSSPSAGLVIGVTLDEYEPASSYAGCISIDSGSVTISSNAAWMASNGIRVDDYAVLNDQGEIKSLVVGGGTVRYTGSLPSSRPETAARFNYSTWLGTVRFENAVLNGSNLAQCGNAGSSILLQNSCGQLSAQTVYSDVTLVGDGFTVTGAVASATVEFKRLSGTGKLTVNAGSSAAGAAYRIDNFLNFTGPIEVCAGSVSVLLGEGADRGGHDGAIVVADGLSLPVGREWMADRVYFGDKVTVEGGLGDTVLYVSGSDTCAFDYVTPTVVDGDPARRYSLDFDPDSRAIFVNTAPVPPTMMVSDVIVEYGTDFTNVEVSVAIEDFWEGFDYEGGLEADLIVRDSSGEIVASGSVTVTGDGVYSFGNFELLGGQGGGFSYEVSVSARETTYGKAEVVAGGGSVSSGVRLAKGWFYEDKDTFVASAKSGTKSGTWSWTGSTPLAYVTNDLIRIETDSADGSLVDFSPYNSASSDVVRVDFDAVFEDIYFPDTYTMPDDLVAAVTLLADGDGCAYAVWDPTVTNLVRVYGGPNATPVPGATNVFSVTINYRDGYMGYSVDGSVLTNSEGCAYFAIPDELKRERDAKVVEVGGKGYFRSLTGDEYNGNLASFGDEEFETVDDAVAAATAAGKTDGLKLLWDASWRPDLDDLGKTFTFDLNDHKLTVDQKSVATMERGGYRVIDNGDGSYTIGVIDYYISFASVDTVTGEMDPQPYSATNMVFALASNRFERAGMDFRSWNLEKDGSGAVEWSDGETIDMTQYGLTNMTLYAQWKVAARLITVEPADEYVYLEEVVTNGATHAGVRFYGTDEEHARGRAVIPIDHGTSVRLVFSTDLERALTYTSTNLNEVVSAVTIAYECLPKIVSASLPVELLTAMTSWADSRSISRQDLAASEFSRSSYLLNTTELLTEQSIVEIGDFEVVEGGCKFKILVNGEPLTDAPQVAGMVWVSDSLASGSDGWKQAAESNVSVTEAGVVTVKTEGPGQFIKLVIPKN